MGSLALPGQRQASELTPSSDTACARVTQGSRATIHVHAPQDVQQAAPAATARRLRRVPSRPLPLLKQSMCAESSKPEVRTQVARLRSQRQRASVWLRTLPYI